MPISTITGCDSLLVNDNILPFLIDISLSKKENYGKMSPW